MFTVLLTMDESQVCYWMYIGNKFPEIIKRFVELTKNKI